MQFYCGSLPCMAGAVAQVDSASQSCVFRSAPRHAFAPHAKRRWLHRASHQVDDGRLIQAELNLDRFKRGPVFPGHFYDAGDVGFAQRNGISGLFWFHATAPHAPARQQTLATPVSMLRSGNQAAIAKRG